MATENGHAKTPSPFFSVFHRKKRQPSAPPRVGIADDCVSFPSIENLPATNGLGAHNEKPSGSKSPQMSFAQRIKYHKDLRSGRLLSELVASQTLPSSAATAAHAEKKKRNESLKRSKAFSADAINELDPVYLQEALETIAEEQPLVAR